VCDLRIIDVCDEVCGSDGSEDVSVGLLELKVSEMQQPAGPQNIATETINSNNE
jgi:hypothetical protein